jgi:putative redox protein
MSEESKFIASAHSVSGQENYEQRIRLGRHTVTSDEPASGGGKDAGAAPYGLLLASLASCTAITLQMYGGRKGWSLGEVKVDLRMFRRPVPQAATDVQGRPMEEYVEREIKVTGEVDDAALGRLAEIAEKTPVTKTLKRAFPITTTLSRA